MVHFYTMNPTITTVKSGKYTFQITDNTLFLRDEIYCRNFKIGGLNTDCVYVSVSYRNGVPVSASMPYLSHSPECSIELPLDKGHGSILMIKTLLRHVHTQLPTLTEIHFEDKSRIECANDDDLYKSGSSMRKPGSHVYPISLYYFSIAFNGETWYEKHFNARHQKLAMHRKYKERVQTVLENPTTKSAMTFLQFLQIAAPPVEIATELESYYTNSNTFNEFFQSIPKPDRCRLVRNWVEEFMKIQLKDAFNNLDWVIELPVPFLGGGKRNTRRRYYCPKCRVVRNTTHKSIGVDAMDV